MKPTYRNLGIGKAFFGQLGKIAEEKVSKKTNKGRSIKTLALTLGSPESIVQEWIGRSSRCVESVIIPELFP